MRLEHVMTRSAIHVQPTDTIVDVALQMRTNVISSVLVCDDAGVLVGILTERDLAHKIIAEGLDCDGLLVRDFMTPNPVSADSRDRVWEGARLMAEHRVHHLPVTREGRPVGVVTNSDIAGMETNPLSTRDVIRGIEQSSQERTLDIPATVDSADLGEIIPAWY